MAAISENERGTDQAPLGALAHDAELVGHILERGLANACAVEANRDVAIDLLGTDVVADDAARSLLKEEAHEVA